MDGIQPPLPPAQNTVYDLTGVTLGKAKKEGAPELRHTKTEFKEPDEIMRSLGFTPDKYMNPLQFLLAVMNDDLNLVFRNEKRRRATEAKGGISIAYRIECAKTAAKYFHKEMPKLQITTEKDSNFGEVLTAAQAGNERILRQTVILEQIERISPDIPIPPASYPPHLSISDARVVHEDGTVEGETLNPEGDTAYDPDAE